MSVEQESSEEFEYTSHAVCSKSVVVVIADSMNSASREFMDLASVS